MRDDHFTFTADDGARLFVYRWRPDFGIGKAVVHIAHGLAEHAGRYARLAETLTDNGYLVYAHDHRGHGRTAQSQDELGYFGEQNGWNRVVQDLAQLCEAEKTEYPQLPLFLLGHSLGSTMAQQLLYEHPDLCDAVALSGANGVISPLVYLGQFVARLERLRLGKRGRSDLINSLSFDAFNKNFQPNRTAFDWLSRDEAEVDKYIADPWCGFTATTQLWAELLSAMPKIARPENRARIRKSLPIYLFTGGEDPVNEQSRGCVALAEDYRRIGLKSTSYKVYPRARHETLNELNREEVTAHLLEWLDALVHLLRNQ